MGFYPLYFVCLLSAATTAAIMWWILSQWLRFAGIPTAEAQSDQWRRIYLLHSAKAFVVVVVTAAGASAWRYGEATADIVHIRMLEAFHLLLGDGLYAFGFILSWDRAVAKAVSTRPDWLPTLRRLAVLGVLFYTLLPMLGLWYVQVTTQRAEARKPPVGDLWEATNRLATAVRENPGYDLRTVEEHITGTFAPSRTAYELYEIGEQKGVFPFRKRSYAGLRRWGALDNLLTALVEHARIAAKRGNWQRCRKALQLALRTMEKAAGLQVPDDLKPRLDPRLVPVQSFALIHIRGGFERIYPLLKEIASRSPAHKRHIEYALQQGRQVGELLAEAGRKGRPLISPQLQPAQYRQLEVIYDESLRKLSLQLLRWDYSVDDALTQISVMEQGSRTR